LQETLPQQYNKLQRQQQAASATDDLSSKGASHLLSLMFFCCAVQEALPQHHEWLKHKHVHTANKTC
jgi:hypothetical protein